jgi:hypothetical protein
MPSAGIPLRPSFVRSIHARIPRPRPFWRMLDHEEDANETSAPKFSAPGRGRCRAVGCLSHCEGARLSGAAGAMDHRVYRRRHHRHHLAPGRPAPDGAVRPAVHHRDPARRRHQYRDRVGGAGAGRRLHAAVRRRPECDQCDLYAKLNFNFIRDIAPVAGIVRVPNAMVVHPSVPATTVQEFIAYAKSNPGKINMASSGVGSSPHLAGELFKMMAGVDVQHVPYRGAAPALTDLLAGQVQLYFVTTPSSIGYIKAGRLRAIAVTTAAPVSELPGVPTIREFLPGFEASAWYGVGSPKDTPADIIGKLNRAINGALADAKVHARLHELGCTIIPGSPAEFGQLIADETEKWGKVVKFSGAKAE